MAKKVRNKKSVLDILVGTGCRHRKLSWRWRVNHIGIGRV